ncbi:hypothetical protein MASR1M104_12930 [Cloacibacterium normanense]
MKKSLSLVDKSRISSRKLITDKIRRPKPKAQYSFGRNVSFLYKMLDAKYSKKAMGKMIPPPRSVTFV